MADRKIAIFGAGGHAREVICLIKDLGRYDEIAGLYEPDDVFKKRSLLGCAGNASVQVQSERSKCGTRNWKRFEPSTRCQRLAAGHPI